MDIHQITFWAAHHIWQMISWVGDILLIEKVVKDAASKRGYKEIVSACDMIANLLNFVLDIVTGIFQSLKNKNGGSNEKTDPASDVPVVPVDSGKS